MAYPIVYIYFGLDYFRENLTNYRYYICINIILHENDVYSKFIIVK